MPYSARILLDSRAPNGYRLVTFEITFPRMVLAEFNTHRIFSRNSASSRAIPVVKMIRQVIQDPVIPIWWGKQQKGMQAEEEITGWRRWVCERIWRGSRYLAITAVWSMWKLGMHKQIPNRLLEPWLFHTVIITATEFTNFFGLRCHKDAQPEIRKIAEMMRDLYYSNEPRQLRAGEWHLPLTGFPGDEELDQDTLIKVSIARCARVSYLTHEGKRDIKSDLQLYERLVSSGHFSPTEHVAQCVPMSVMLEQSGNLRGWKQYRKMIPGEHREEYDPTQ